MQLIPALDVLGDDAVRLEQGDYNRVLFRQPLEEFMERIVATGPPLVHVVDLQGARDGVLRPRSSSDANARRAIFPSRFRGAFELDSARAALDAGAQRVIVGTALWADDDALDVFVESLGDQLVAALDVRDGQIAVRGWRRVPISLSPTRWSVVRVRE